MRLLVERALDAKGNQWEGLFDAFAKAACGSGMGLGERIGQPFELSPGKRVYDDTIIEI